MVTTVGASVPVLFALFAALCNAVATVLQRRAALTVPRSDHLRPGLMLDLVRRPVWLGGMVAVVAAAVCQAVALATGALSVVQPLFVLELPLTLLVASLLFHHGLPRAGWAAVACVVTGLGVALATASPAGNRTHVPIDRWVPAVAVCAGVVAVLVVVAFRRPVGGVRAACLGGATAICYALTAALMKTATHILDVDGLIGLLTAWQTYGFAATGVGALFLLENTMQAGPLVASQPVLTVGDALVSVALGATLYDEHIRSGWWVLPEVCGVVLIVLGAMALARTSLAQSLMSSDVSAPVTIEASRGPM